MKSYTLGNLYQYIGIISAFAFILPTLFLVWQRKINQWSFLAIGLNYFLTFLYNVLALGFFPVSKIFLSYLAITNNILDAPLVLLFLMYFMEDGALKKTLKKIIPLFTLFGIVTFFIMGRTKETNTIVSGPGIALILFYSFPVFIRQIKAAVGPGRETGKAFMISSVVFVYTCYAVVYFLFYIFDIPEKLDVVVMYHLASLVATLLMLTGLVLENRKVELPVGNGQKKFTQKIIFPDWDELPLR